MLMHPDTAAALDSFSKGYQLGVTKADEDAAKLGAARERRRIRRAQWEALDMLIIRRNALSPLDVATADTISRAVELLAAATKAPKKARRK